MADNKTNRETLNAAFGINDIGGNLRNNKEEVRFCPYCNNKLEKNIMPGQGKVWLHKDKKCRHYFRNDKEIEEAKREILKKEEIEKKTEPISKIEIREEECEVVDKPDFLFSESEKNSFPQVEENEDNPRKELRIRRIKTLNKAAMEKIISKNSTWSEEEKIQRESHINIIEDTTQILTEKKVEVPFLTDLETGESINIDKPVFKIGRKNADLIIDSAFVSKTHAQIIVKNDNCYVKDIGSTNGSFINGVELPKNTEIAIKDRQSIKFASKEYLFNKE